MNRVEGRFFSRDLFNIFRPSPSQLDTNRMRIHNSRRFPRENSRNRRRRRYENFNKVELQSSNRYYFWTRRKNFALTLVHFSIARHYLVVCERKLNRRFHRLPSHAARQPEACFDLSTRGALLVIRGHPLNSVVKTSIAHSR